MMTYQPVGHDNVGRQTYGSIYICDDCGREMEPRHVYHKLGNTDKGETKVRHRCPVCERAWKKYHKEMRKAVLGY